MRARLSATLVGGCLILIAASALVAANAPSKGISWPQWRGPNRDAVSADKGLLKSWGENGPPLAWKASGLGEGLSSIVIADGRIFTMGKRGGKELLMALDAKGGKELWSATVGVNSAESPASTPTVDGDRVYALGPSGDLVCVQASDGKELWRKSYTKDLGGVIPTWKYCESPLVDGNKLICTPGSDQATVVALDKLTGDVLWKSAVSSDGDNGYGYSSPVIGEGAGIRQYVQMLGNKRGCIGVAADDGRLLWKYSRVGNGTATIPTPIVDGDLVFCSSGYGTGAALLRLSKAGNAVKAEEVYFLPGNQFQNHHGGMIHIGDYIYCGHGHNNGFPICLEMKTGKVAWGGKERGPGTGSAAVVYADGQLYFRYENGLMALVSAAHDGYHLNGTFKIPQVSGPSWSHPVVAGGKLYLREQDNLFVYELTTR